MFDLIQQFSQLQEAYVHPADVCAHFPGLLLAVKVRLCLHTSAPVHSLRPQLHTWAWTDSERLCVVLQEGYIGADQNWEYLNRYIQPVSSSACFCCCFCSVLCTHSRNVPAGTMESAQFRGMLIIVVWNDLLSPTKNVHQVCGCALSRHLRTEDFDASQLRMAAILEAWLAGLVGEGGLESESVKGTVE
jgi:hypothetical protein